MKGDFTRYTFDRKRHFSRVLMQQGRVTLDADHNEQTEILLHYMRTLARDLIGPHAAPAVDGGFSLEADANGNLVIGAGRYYVDGILVENDDDCLYKSQPEYALAADDPLAREASEQTGKLLWVYLDVWERHVTAIEDDRIRETALGGPDTCTRAKVVWQVRALDLKAALVARRDALALRFKQSTDPAEQAALEQEITALEAEISDVDDAGVDDVDCDRPLSLVEPAPASLAARVDPGQRSDNPCVTPPDSKYRGAENQLYRVEVHAGGSAATATFKWSRDNGSVAAAWLGSAGNELSVSSSRGFSAGCWVELSDDAADLQGARGTLVKLAKVRPGTLTVDPSTAPPAWSQSLVNPKARRWDQTETGDVVLNLGAVPVKETPPNTPPDLADWIDLEDGVQVQFLAGGVYRTGDYWLIPARAATGTVEWPAAKGTAWPQLVAPSGIDHHYAPLGYVRRTVANLEIGGCRCEFEPASDCFLLLDGNDKAGPAKPRGTKAPRSSKKKPVSPP